MEETHTYIDLFAGCGGLSLGLHNAGWEGLFAIEKSPQAFHTLAHNLIEKKKHFKWVNWHISFFQKCTFRFSDYN